MAGNIKRLIDTIIAQRAHGDKILEGTVKIKLILKGIDPKNYTAQSDDDPVLMGKLQEMIDEYKLNAE